jgi:NAD(P)H-hydrate repair Nnr-like enzyme with NAD(P)H-hydrate epimerase domain
VPLALLLALLALGAVAVGCGGKTLDAGSTEDLVKANTENVRGAKVSSVDCPSGIEVEAGTTFDCTVVFASGKEATAKLKIRDSEANLNFEALSPSK